MDDSLTPEQLRRIDYVVTRSRLRGVDREQFRARLERDMRRLGCLRFELRAAETAALERSRLRAMRRLGIETKREVKARRRDARGAIRAIEDVAERSAAAAAATERMHADIAAIERALGEKAGELEALVARDFVRYRRRYCQGAASDEAFGHVSDRSVLEVYAPRVRLPSGTWETERRLVARAVGLRSEVEPMLAPIVAAHPARGRIRTGITKTSLGDPSPSKLKSLDDRYSRFGGEELVSLARIDIDRRFRSERALRERLEELLPPGLMPYLVVCEVGPDGAVRSPHLYWLLENPVCISERGRPGPIRLLRAFCARMVSRLSSIGADPGCLSNLWHGKNPMSESWDLIHVGGRVRDLRRAFDALDGEVSDRVSLLRRCELARGRTDGVLDTRSNHTFNECYEFCRSHVGEYRERGDWHGFVGALNQHLLDVDESGGNPEKREARLHRMAVKGARIWWTRRPRVDTRNRGAAAERIERGHDLQERQAIGARYTSERRAEATLRKLVDAVRALDASGEEATASAAAKISGVSRATAYRRLAEALAIARRPIEPAPIEEVVDEAAPWDPSPCVAKTDVEASMELAKDPEAEAAEPERRDWLAHLREIAREAEAAERAGLWRHDDDRDGLDPDEEDWDVVSRELLEADA